MKNITLLFLLFSLSCLGQTFSDWQPVLSPHVPLTTVAWHCGELYALEYVGTYSVGKGNLWNSLDTGKTWNSIYGSKGPVAVYNGGKVYMNSLGIMSIRTLGPSTSIYKWDCDLHDMVLVTTESTFTSGWNEAKYLAISNDYDEFKMVHKYYSPSGVGNFCEQSITNDMTTWVSISCDSNFTADTIPTCFVQDNYLIAKHDDAYNTLSLLPDILNGRKVLNSFYIEDDAWIISFLNGQILISFDEGATWTECVFPTPPVSVYNFLKDDYGIYFASQYNGPDQKIISPNKFVGDKRYYSDKYFNHKGLDFALRWNNIYQVNFNVDASYWPELYSFPEGKMMSTNDRMLYYGEENGTNFIFNSNNLGKNWQIIVAPIPITTIVTNKSQWFIWDQEEQLVYVSDDIGQTWVDVSIDAQVDTIYEYDNKVFLISSDAYYSWDKKNMNWNVHQFKYETYPKTDIRFDKFLVFIREVEGDSLFNFYVTNLTSNESRKVVLPEEFQVREDYLSDFFPGATDYLLKDGALYICDRYHAQGIKYAYSTPIEDTLFIQTDFCPEEGLNLGDTTLFFASQDTIQFLDHFFTPVTAVLDVAPFESVETIHKDTIMNYGDMLFGQDVYSDTTLLEYINTDDGCDKIVEWNVALIVNTISIDSPLLTVFPNPSFGDIFLQSDQAVSNIQLKVYDLLGRLVSERVVHTNSKFVINSLSKGSYHLVFKKDGWQKHLLWIKL